MTGLTLTVAHYAIPIGTTGAALLILGGTITVAHRLRRSWRQVTAILVAEAALTGSVGVTADDQLGYLDPVDQHAATTPGMRGLGGAA